MQKLLSLIKGKAGGSIRPYSAQKHLSSRANGRPDRHRYLQLRKKEPAKLLSSAVERQELELHYQPQYSLVSQSIVGVEAFLRWRNPRLGLLPAREFVGLAEETGGIFGMGHWALNRAAHQLQTWRETFPSVSRIALNVSPLKVIKAYGKKPWPG